MSTKRFSISKGIVSLMIMLVAVIALVACGGNNDQKLVDEALDAIAINYQTGDTDQTITKNITLPTTSGTVTVTWTSSNTAVISNTGVVTRGEADTVVSLTATLTLGDVSETKVFTVKVLAAPVVIDPADALAALVITGDSLEYNETTQRYSTTSNVTLPGVSQTLTVTWTSGNEAVISAAGVVTRPAWGQTDSTVILTATIGEETRDFAVTVLAETVKPVSAKLADASDALLLAGTSAGVAADIVLPTSAGSEGVTVTWSSDKPESLDATGKVTRLLENVTVTLTATLSLEGQSVTKEFEIVVLSFAEFTVVTDIAEAIAEGSGKYVQVPGVTVVGKTTEGYMIYDGSAILFVYTKSAPAESVVVDNVYTITGLTDLFNGSFQFNGSKDPNTPVILEASTEAVSVLTPTVITGSVSDFVATLPSSYAAGEMLTYQYVTLSAKIQVQGTNNYDTFLVNLDHDGTPINAAENSAYTTDAFVVYYKSNKAAVRALDGVKVDINVFVYSLRTDRNIYTVIFTGDAEDITVRPLSDAEAVAAAKTGVVAAVPTQQVENGTMTLPTDLLGTTIVWTSSNNDVIDPTTGLVTRVEGTLTEVTLTATISKGSVTDTQEVVVKVGELPLSTIATVNAADANSTLYRVRGTLVGTDFRNNYYITNGTESITVRGYDAVATTLNANIGKEVEVVGKKALFNGLRQLDANDAKLIGDGIVVEAINADDVEMSATGYLPLQGSLVELTQVKVQSREEKTSGDAPNTYPVVTIVLEQILTGKTIQLRWDGRVTLSTETKAMLDLLVVDKVVNVEAIVGWFNNPQLVVIEQLFAEEVALTDDSKVVLDAAALTQPATMTEAGTLTLPATGTNGSTIVWSSDSVLVDAATAAVTMPEEGQVTVTLTATLTLNAVTEVVTFEIKLGTASVSEPVVTTMLGSSLSTAVGTTSNTSLVAGTSFSETVDYATGLGLDTAIFDVEFIKNAANMWAVNNGVLRGYYNTAGGSEVAISTTASYQIQSITINLLGANNAGDNSLLVNGTAYAFNISDKLTGTAAITVEAINLSAVNIVCNHTNRMYIQSVVITYAAITPAA